MELRHLRYFAAVAEVGSISRAAQVVRVAQPSLSRQLRQLEAQGLVTRKVMDTAPVSVHYEITPFGRTALGFLDELRKWSEGLPEDASELAAGA